MKLQMVCSRFIIFTLPSDKLINKGAIIKAIHNIQRENSMPVWKKIKVDIFCSGKECLYFIYPEEVQNVHLASYALQYLSDYFTE